MEPTYNELATALKKLGFANKSTSDTFVYENKKYGAIVILPMGSDTERVHKANFASLSCGLEEQGVLKHEHDLGKIIEQMRLSEKTAAA